MKFLIDNALSPLLSNLLLTAGHDSVHVRDRNLQHADDETIFDAAVAEHRIVISADTDFGTLTSFSGPKRISVILFRHPSPRRADQQAQLLLSNLSSFEEDLIHGAIVVLRQDRIRVRRLI